jgi:hypothetical protein
MEKLIVPSILSVTDVVSMSDRIFKIIQKLIGHDPKLNGLYEKANLVYKRLVKNQKNTTKSRLTEELVNLDKQRDRAFVALRDILHGMSISLIEEVNSSAAKLYATLDKLGLQAYQLGYKAETAVLISLFADFDLADRTQLLADIGALPFYKSLKNAQAAFDTASSQKSDEKTVLTSETEAATSIMAEMIPALTSLVSLVQLYTQTDAETYGESFNQIVTCITETNATARARKTRKENEPVVVKVTQPEK